jgi:hypothetical protein
LHDVMQALQPSIATPLDGMLARRKMRRLINP